MLRSLLQTWEAVKHFGGFLWRCNFTCPSLRATRGSMAISRYLHGEMASVATLPRNDAGGGLSKQRRFLSLCLERGIRLTSERGFDTLVVTRVLAPIDE